MRRAGTVLSTVPATVLVMVLLTVSACGSAPSTPASGSSPGTASPGVGTSPGGGVPGAATVCSGGKPETVAADLTGDGRKVELTFERYANCSPVFGTTDGAITVSAHVDDLPLARDGLRALTIAGRTGQLVLLVQSQPRGGYQAHLFGYARGAFEELEVAGRPVLPFVATDTGGALLAARCAKDGVTVLTAKQASKRTWDVSLTPYLIEGNQVTQGPTAAVDHDLNAVALRQKYPDLPTGTLFADC